MFLFLIGCFLLANPGTTFPLAVKNSEKIYRETGKVYIDLRKSLASETHEVFRRFFWLLFLINKK